ncbi:MAG TPA: glycosyltransferase [Solirubrobacteraceae bacterium]|jgi:glycosyltransferase involved in cell wall biosynthesis|nr:glycosyltransferase [Solirubrobacteraceae bacterium]
MDSNAFIILTARNEADRLGATMRALVEAFPGTPIWVGDDGSSDETSQVACEAGATVVRSERPIGKGAAATLTARRALERLRPPGDAIAVLCDGDLGACAGQLVELLVPLERDEADLAVAAFARRLGGGLGFAVGFARWAIRRRCGLLLQAPISGQRALRVRALEDVLPFAGGFGMEMGMTIDAARAGNRISEVALDLEHRATGRTLSGFAHRGRQLVDFVCVYLERR